MRIMMTVWPIDFTVPGYDEDGEPQQRCIECDELATLDEMQRCPTCREND